MYNKVSTNMNFVEREKEIEKFWRDNEHFADLFNAYFFNGEKVIKPEELQEADTDVSGTLNKKSLSN